MEIDKIDKFIIKDSDVQIPIQIEEDVMNDFIEAINTANNETQRTNALLEEIIKVLRKKVIKQ